ncbi:conserved domain protein [Trichinella spiralis]|uniref:hypothetical protein n=1 Tax=Trichinella spiralis TaxID=6334 RepID=UPI0001EFBDDB|nr:conserved domain protein [Trichinella spiralis]
MPLDDLMYMLVIVNQVKCSSKDVLQLCKRGCCDICLFHYCLLIQATLPSCLLNSSTSANYAKLNCRICVQPWHKLIILTALSFRISSAVNDRRVLTSLFTNDHEAVYASVCLLMKNDVRVVWALFAK